VKISRNELLTALESVKPGIANKELIEQSTAFVFQAGRVYTYNDLIAVSHPCPPGLSGAVQSKELHALLKRSADDELEITTTETEMLIKGKRNKAGIALQAEITLPIAEVGAKKTWTALPEGFAAAVKFVLFSAGADMTKPWSTAVHIDGANVETCDNFRLTRYALAGRDKNKAVKGDLLIPASACAALVGYAPTHYSIDDQWAHFMNKMGTEFSCRVVADKFPDLSPFVDRKWAHEIEFHVDTAAILERATVFLAADKNVMPTVSIKVMSGRMVIAAKGSAGWFEETVRVTASKEDFVFEINPQALKDMLPLIKDCELSDDKSVLKFEGDNFIHCCATSVSE
jgi:DNA polymerase III sliding clamp (beta) subunit (PCNA family)